MRVAVVNATVQLGGAGIIAADVARGLASRGHQVVFISTSERARRYYDADLGCSVELVATGPQTPLAHFINPVACAGLLRALRRFAPDAVSIHNVNLQTFSAASLLVARVYPTAWTLHDVWPVCMTGWPEPPDCLGMHRGCRDCPTWPDWQTRTSRALKDVVFAAAPMTVVCPSAWMADTVASSLGAHRTQVVRNGVDTGVFTRQDGARDEWGLDADETVVLFSGGRRVSGTSPAFRKGWKYLAKALELLGDTQGVRLLYAGDPIDVSQLGVPVTFTGPLERSKMPLAYSAADVCVLPTLGDNAPLGVLEAMAVGVPIVASSVGGVPEVLSGGRSAELCDARDAEGLAQCLGRVLADADYRERLASEANSDLCAQLTLPHMIDGYESVLGEIADV